MPWTEHIPFTRSYHLQDIWFNLKYTFILLTQIVASLLNHVHRQIIYCHINDYYYNYLKYHYIINIIITQSIFHCNFHVSTKFEWWRTIYTHSTNSLFLFLLLLYVEMSYSRAHLHIAKLTYKVRRKVIHMVFCEFSHTNMNNRIPRRHSWWHDWFHPFGSHVIFFFSHFII